MNTEERACALRAEGYAFDRIAALLGISTWHATRCARLINAEVKETARTVVRRAAYNGGCSSTSGMMAVSMPRINALHGALA